jgi:hypothetical protein
MRTWSARFVARFSLLYAAVVLVSAMLPIYVWIEHALVWLVDPMLLSASGAPRELWIAGGEDGARYQYEVELISGARRALGGPIHLHGFVPLSTLALVLATPRPGRVRRASLAAAGVLACSLVLALGMLMSDLQGYERAAFPGSSGPFPRAIALFDGLHRTAGAGLLPLVLWTFACYPLRRDDRDR